MKKSFKPTSNENQKVKHTRFLGLCKSCGLCIEKCPVKCLRFSKKKVGVFGLPGIEIDIDKCTACLTCERICPEQAIKVTKKKVTKKKK